ncbi:hypothetical protein [Botrimarina sp.]|uniref:hypothetical protein n=1 Tax=Botrimarina sp. TaxID=2795802 RepID=UPI0032EFCA4E
MPNHKKASEQLPPFIQRDGDRYRFQWRTAALLVVILCVGTSAWVAAAVTFGLMPSFPFGVLAALHALWVAGFLAYGVNQERRYNAGLPSQSSRGFGLLEALILLTGVAVALGLLSYDHRRQLTVEARLESLELRAAEVLGPDGGIYQEPNGAHVFIDDRTFNDERLARFTAMAREAGLLKYFAALTFGSRPKNLDTPAKWPGVTEDSLTVLSQWPALEVVRADGTALAPEKLQAWDDDAR